MRILNVIFLSYLLVGFLGCSSNNKMTCQEAFELCIKSKREKFDHNDLLEKVANLVKSEPQCEIAYLLKADLLFECDSFQQALNAYTDLSKFKNFYSLANFRIGKIYSYLDKEDSAIHYYENVIRFKTVNNVVADFNNDIRPENYKNLEIDIPYNEIVFNLALSLYYLGRYSEAKIKFDECIQLGYLLNESFLYRGVIYLTLNKNMLACSDLLIAKQMGNKVAESYIEKYCK